MALNFNKINPVSAETKSAISRKSAQTLPNNPSERGYSAEEIKRRFYQPILDAANSALAEIDRVVNEANITFSQVSDELDNFIDTTRITEAYKVELDNTSWSLNESTQMYELIITKAEHNIQDYKEIGVNMFLLDGNGKYTQVNQFEVGIDGAVRCFHETNGAGYISIYVKREGFIVGSTVVDADHVVGLAKVGRTNDFNDLDNIPDLEQMSTNEVMISKIISGGQAVHKATYAEESDTATYAKTSGAADSAETALTANNAIADQFGVNIHNGYSKQNGNYPSMIVGKSITTDKATGDEEGINIKSNYAKQNGSYPNMSVGNATNALNSTNSVNSQKATSDSNGANIASTYAKQNGSYSGMSVGKATEAILVTGKIASAVTATTQATTDRSAKISTTQHAFNVVNNQITFLNISLTATLYVESKNYGGITLSGYGIKVYSPSENCYYWMGNLQGQRGASGDYFSNVKRADLKGIGIAGLNINKVVSGGILSHKESDDDNNESGILCDTEGIKNSGNYCSYYAEDPGEDWALDEHSYISITNFIVKLR